jgi:hypothetical protein
MLTCGVVVVELRGFEPLTPCMPSRDPGKSSTMKPHITRHHSEAIVVMRGVSRGLMRLEMLPLCCRRTIVRCAAAEAAEVETPAV